MGNLPNRCYSLHSRTKIDVFTANAVGCCVSNNIKVTVCCHRNIVECICLCDCIVKQSSLCRWSIVSNCLEAYLYALSVNVNSMSPCEWYFLMIFEKKTLSLFHNGCVITFTGTPDACVFYCWRKIDFMNNGKIIFRLSGIGYFKRRPDIAIERDSVQCMWSSVCWGWWNSSVVSATCQ